MPTRQNHDNHGKPNEFAWHNGTYVQMKYMFSVYFETYLVCILVLGWSVSYTTARLSALFRKTG